MTATDLSRVVAIIPVRTLSGAKSRLGEPLDAEERSELVLALLRRTVEAARASRRVSGVLVVSQDDDLLTQARAMGADTLLQRGTGLNEALDEARAAAEPNASAILVLPADLPGVSASAIDDLVSAAEHAAGANPGCPVAVLAPDRHGTGTNALLLAPTTAAPFRFGEGSRSAHLDAAAANGAVTVEVDGPLAFDLDTPADLLEADLRGLGHAAGR